MSRGYSKFYSRKLNNGSQASIQFDKLFHENSNRPSAAKSAGTIGRWGVISCTSLRSTNINGRRDEGISNKRMRIDFGSRPTSKDPFSFETDPEKIASGERPPPVSKPKKFFKSRNIDSPQEDVINSSMYVGSNCNTEVNYGMQSTRKYSKNQASGGSKKFFSGKKNEDTAESSVSKPAVPAREENKPPIVLRIFKGTSHLVNELKVSSVHPSNKSGSDSVIVRSSSRKKNHVDTNCEYRVTVVHAGSDSSNTSITPPKKSGKESKNKHAEKEREREEKREKERLEKTEEKVKEIEKVEEKRSESPVPVDDVERAVAALEAGEELYDQQDQDFSAESAVEEVSSASNSLPLSLCYPPNQDSNYMTSCSTENTVESKDLNETQEIPEEDKQDEILKEDNEKLLKAEELLADTYIDFAGTTEKLMQFPQHSSVSPVPTGHTKTFSEHSWFSDSEGSNSILDQINTLTSNQTSRDDSNLEKTENELEGTEQTSPELIDTQELPATQELTDCQEQEEKTFETEQETENDIDMETGRELRSGHISSPAAKKGSIFKSRSLQSDGPRTRRAVYKHKWADTDKEPGPGSSQPSDIAMATNTSEPAVASAYDVDEFEFGKLTRVTTWPAGNTEGRFEEDVVTRVKCNKKDKEYYTVVRNVKRAHQIQESGEFQEFNDDVEYILDALQDNYPIGTRCLSAISLASKCMAPAFRMHVRAHGTVTKFFRALHDATKDQSLALCTATVMFVLSQDRLNMDLDRHSLELMLNLLESDASHRNALDDCGMSSAQLHKNKQKVRELCGEIQGQGHAKHLNLDNITAGHLAMETLLSLTSRRAGEWFKEELRELGGLEHIVKTISECCRQLGEFLVQWTDPLLDQLRKVDRCLRVLENVTHQHEENQLYLLKYGNGILVDTLYRLFCQCDSEIPLYPVIDETDKESPGVVIREALLATLKVLINLSHDFNNQSYGSTMFGEKKGIVDTCLHVLLQVPQYVPEQKKFDLLVLALILLINLVEHSQANRKQLFEARIMNDEDIFYSRTKSAVEVLIALFYEQEELARAEEMKTDEILDGKKDSEEPVAEPAPPKSQEEFIEETVAKLLQKAGRNMEHTLIGAYIGLLLGYLIIDTKEYEIYVRQCLPEGNFKTIISVLQKVYNFMNLTASAVGSSRGIAQTERVINCLIKSDANADTAAANAAAAAAAVMLEAAKVLDTSMDCSSVLDDTVS